MCVLELGFRLRPTTPGWTVGVCVSLCTFCLTPAISRLGFVVRGLGVAWHLFLCCGWLRVVRAAQVCGTHGASCLAPVHVPWLWLVACPSGVPHGPALVRRTLSSPFALCAPVVCSVAVVTFPSPGLAPPDLLGGCAGHVEAG